MTHSTSISDEKKMFKSALLNDIFRYGFVYGGKLAFFPKTIFEGIL